jgi:hypothetical protein
MTALPLTLETKLRRGSDMLLAGVGDEESVMMSVSQGKVYGLNALAGAIWQLLDTPKTVAEVCAVIQEAFEIDAKTCEADVLRFVDALIGYGAVEVAPA